MRGGSGWDSVWKGDRSSHPKDAELFPPALLPVGGAPGLASTPGSMTEESLSCPAVTRASHFGSWSLSFLSVERG